MKILRKLAEVISLVPDSFIYLLSFQQTIGES